MTEIEEDLNRWLTAEEIARLINCDQQTIEEVIRGMTDSVAKSPKHGNVVNLTDLKEYLTIVPTVCQAFFAKFPDKEKGDNDPFVVTKSKLTQSTNLKDPELGRGSGTGKDDDPDDPMVRSEKLLSGREAAEELGCPYSQIAKTFPAKYPNRIKRHGRGWRIRRKTLNELKKDSEFMVAILGRQVAGPLKENDDSKNVGDPDKDIKSEQAGQQSDPGEPSGSASLKEKTVQPQTSPSKIITVHGQIASDFKRSVSIRKRKYGCLESDIVRGVGSGINVSTIRKWAKDEQIKIIVVDRENYIDPQTLRDFFAKQGIAINFEEYTGDPKNRH